MTAIIEQVLSKDEVRDFRRQLDQAAWPDAQAVGTAGSLARLVKHNQQLDEASLLAVALGNRILRNLAHNDRFTAFAHPRLIYPPRFNRYADGGSYGFHSDSALLHVANSSIVVRSDLSATLFLSEPDEYDGGELEIETASEVQAIKLSAGDMILYPSGALHRVTPVTRGARVSSFMWLQSLVRDDAARETLFQLDVATQRVNIDRGPQDQAVIELTGVYHNLLRRWAEV